MLPQQPKHQRIRAKPHLASYAMTWDDALYGALVGLLCTTRHSGASWTYPQNIINQYCMGKRRRRRKSYERFEKIWGKARNGKSSLNEVPADEVTFTKETRW